jgi:hypothetical protein
MLRWFLFPEVTSFAINKGNSTYGRHLNIYNAHLNWTWQFYALSEGEKVRILNCTKCFLSAYIGHIHGTVIIPAATRNYFALPSKLIWCTPTLQGTINSSLFAIPLAHRPVIWQWCILACLLHKHRSTSQIPFKTTVLITMSLWNCIPKKNLKFIF